MSDAKISRPEFIALLAMLTAMLAFAIDAMLPALPQIGADLSPASPNRGQLVLTVFVIGLGLGTFIAGPISDALGRKRVILGGLVLYVLGATLASTAQSLDTILAARLLQGLGAAGPRVVSMAVIRDLYSGRQMAKISSLVQFIFVLFPAVAPLIGETIMHFGSWRSIFWSFVIFGIVGGSWMQLRLPETLAPENRRPFRPGKLMEAAREVFAIRSVVLTIAVLALVSGMFFAMLQSTHMIFDQVFDRGASFGKWFLFLSLMVSSASVINARLVVRLGMWRIVTAMLMVQTVLSLAILGLSFVPLPDPVWFGFYLFWQGSMFFQAGVTMGNLNAIGMEPLGHIAGMAASIIGGVATVCAMIIAAPLGLAFDGTLVPLAAGVFGLCVLAVGLMFLLRRDVEDF
ncbi:multidrug effflux MFS transporter [Alisedimentitalea sp. MJ-SS2]|uniref:multidrug effflux MFS transporter n=1 Tax=Aliisedimentitalea sp. MJ-SS2 TaxID=3049795 RepID=UPI00290CF56A|nr:multidrug effflux MFS transporter [Alisedimentitalea sp. MJ-SS2]MDU8926887.1 multidrug effflux MFS transporter [Alisedimentitalea sp. MJ-SS2]